MGGGGLWSLWFIILIAAAISGAVIAHTKPPETVAWINRSSEAWNRRYFSAKEKGGWIVGGLWRWLIWGFHKSHNWTEAIGDDAVRAGVRLALFFLVGGLSLMVIAAAVYLVVVLTILLVGLWILGKVLDWDSPTPNRGLRESVSRRRGTSRQRTGWFGDEYTEHRDTGGEKVGESRQRTGWFGDEYTEHRDADGEKAGESRQRTGWFGDEYTEHLDADGEKAGESRQRAGWFGDEYTEHRDADGEKTGESRRRTGWFGDEYTQHDPKD